MPYARQIARNSITIEEYVLPDRWYPYPPDAWCEITITPPEGAWSTVEGSTVSLSGEQKKIGDKSIELFAGVYGVPYHQLLWTFNAGAEVDTDFYPYMRFWIYLDSSFYTGTLKIILTDSSGQKVARNDVIPAQQWVPLEEYVGSTNATLWLVDPDNTQPFNWASVKQIEIQAEYYAPGPYSGRFYLDEFHFSYEVAGYRTIVVNVNWLNPETNEYTPIAGATVALGRPLPIGGYWYDYTNTKTTDTNGQTNFTDLDPGEGPFAIEVDATDLGFQIGHYTGIDVSTSDQTVTVTLEPKPPFDWKKYVKYTLYGGIALAVIWTTANFIRETV